MAKRGKKSGGTGKSELLGPLYEGENGYELGAHKVEGPKGPKSVPDPIGFGHNQLGHGPKAEQRHQTYQKD